MDQRLARIYSLLATDGKGIIDVGTDHGLIPILLARNGYTGSIFATDIREGPLNTARAAAAQAGVADRIEFQLCDGLALCPPERVDCIAIAGMGGDTVCGILDRAEWLFSAPYRLVLQPMTRAEVLRYWLIHNGFCIVTEEVVAENGHIYQLFAAEQGTSAHYMDSEYLVGKKPHHGNNPGFQLLISEQLTLVEKKLTGMRISGQQGTPAFCFYDHIRKELTRSFSSCQ
ncbi:MAG: class I SAM-dependent methyltransferase [Oscillospiraceae bacterium]|nr:class I SAM-dependent methyltransferase [Oscillospiraceae bacterium]